MGIIFITAIGLSMDACAASIALSSKHKPPYKLLLAAVSFAFFQSIMPVFGYILGLPFEKIIAPFDHWVAFLILSALGGNMIFDLKKEHELEEQSNRLTLKLIVALSIATSIDAFVVGIGFHALNFDLINGVIIIGVVTLVMSLLGLLIGRFFNHAFSDYAEKIGGLILILLGLKILISHLLGI